ncbi:MAG: GTPase [Methanoregulaceae archaeon]
MEFEKLPTVPTADELLDRSLRRAAKKMREKENKDRANEEFVRAVGQALHDRLVAIIQSFPEFESLPPFYREMTEIMFGIERMKIAFGALGWAAKQSKLISAKLARETRKAETSSVIRKRAVARLASVLHQIEKELLFLNVVRNELRKLPHMEEGAFTIVVSGYPNVGKSSFIRLVSTAEPEIASYPFTTKGIIVGHRRIGRDKILIVDTPGILDRPAEERNPIERQALAAIMNVANVILFILDASEQCGYSIEEQIRLLHEVEGMAASPVITVVNKSDVKTMEGYPNMSTGTNDGVPEVLELLLSRRPARQRSGLREPLPGQNPE